MAIGIFKLTRTQRRSLGGIFCVFNIVQVVIGFIMTAMSAYIGLAVGPVLYSERSEITYVFTVIGWAGLSIMVNYIFGIWLCKRILQHGHKKSTRMLLLTWTSISFYLTFYIMVLSALSRKIYKHIIRSIKHSFHIGMLNYLKDPIWKVTIDRIQLDLQCCGNEGFKEWHEIIWLDRTYQVNDKSELIKQLQGGGNAYGNLPVTPWSCCRRSFPMQCFHDPLQQVHATKLWADKPSLVEESINPTGCIDTLKMPIRLVIIIFILLAVLNLLVQLAIFLSSRILYTSCRNALLLNQQDLLDAKTGTAPGWICGRGDCGYNRGKTVMQIMGHEDRSQTNLQSTPEESNEQLVDIKKTG